MGIEDIFKFAFAFEKLAKEIFDKKSNNFTVVGCTRGKIYEYQKADKIFVKGDVFLSGDSLPLKEIKLEENPEPKDQGNLYLIKD